MADTKLTGLDSLSSTQSNDLLYIVSLQNIGSGESKKISVGDFLGNISIPIATSDAIRANSISLSSNVAATNYTGGNINVTYVNASTGIFNNLISDFIPLTANTNIIAIDPEDKSRVYHLDTSTGNLSVGLPSSLPNGFNFRITNTGTNTIYVSSTQTPMICAFSNRCTLQFGSLFIYKANDKLFGTGDFFR